MIGKILKLRKKPFVRNVLIMATGTAAAQLISTALTPIITRLYGPEAFGIMGVFASIVAILSPIAALTYPYAIVLPKNDNDAKGLIRLSIYISVMISMIVTFIIMMFSSSIVNLFKIEDTAPFIFLTPVVILLSGILQVIEQWLIRTNQFRITAKATFLQAIIIQGSKVGIGLYYPFASVLVILTVFNQAIKAIIMTIGIQRSDRKLTRINEEKVSVIELAKQYKDFLLFRTPQNFIDSVTQSLPNLLLASFFGTTAVGFYTIGKTVLSLPVSLISTSVGDVFYPRFSEAANNQSNLTILLKKTTIVLGSVGIIPFGIVIMFGPSIFSLVFGVEWARAGEYARWIALWSFSSFIISPCIRALPVLSAQKLHLKYTIYSLVIRLVALITGGYIFLNDLVAVALFGISSGLLNIILMILTFRISQNHDSSSKMFHNDKINLKLN